MDVDIVTHAWAVKHVQLVCIYQNRSLYPLSSIPPLERRLLLRWLSQHTFWGFPLIAISYFWQLIYNKHLSLVNSLLPQMTATHWFWCVLRTKHDALSFLRQDSGVHVTFGATDLLMEASLILISFPSSCFFTNSPVLIKCCTATIIIISSVILISSGPFFFVFQLTQL